jgi:septum formation protein
MRLVLGSNSPFRKTLLEKLGLPFVTDGPDIDEAPNPGETPAALVQRLARAKAGAVAGRHPRALVIGSDQVASCDGEILGKPGNRAGAIAQLTAMSGREVVFHTGLCLLNTESGASEVGVEPFRVRFRDLSQRQIARYLDSEQPYDCAGSFRSEGFGITLFRALQGRDPNALVGLPLILLVEMLGRQGVELP